MTNTKMDDFKQALYLAKNTFSTQDAQLWSKIETVNHCIENLLNDDLMMQAKNEFTFSERTLATRYSLMVALGEIMAEDSGDNYSSKAKAMFLSLARCSVQIRNDRR